MLFSLLYIVKLEHFTELIDISKSSWTTKESGGIWV